MNKPKLPDVVDAEVIGDGDAALALDEPGELLGEALMGLSERSRRAYHGDWRRFGKWWGDRSAEQAVRDLVGLTAVQARRLVKRYREHMERDGLAPASVARAIRALNGVVKALHYVGASPWVLGAKAPRAIPYRDVRGPSDDVWQRLLEHVQADTTLKGRRDLAILRLLHDAVLRETEVCTLDVEHFERGRRPAVWILNKGHRERTRVDISTPARDATAAWVAERGEFTGPLFTRLSRKGKIPETDLRLKGHHIYYVVRSRAEKAGIEEKVAPHRLRHSGITKAAKSWDGPLVELQKYARHADPRTTMRYVDDVGGASSKIAELVGGGHGDQSEDSD